MITKPHMTGGEQKRAKATAEYIAKLSPMERVLREIGASYESPHAILVNDDRIQRALIALIMETTKLEVADVAKALTDTAARLREVEADRDKLHAQLFDMTKNRDHHFATSEKHLADWHGMKDRAIAAEQERDRLNEERTKDINGLIDCAGRLAAVEAQRDGLLKAAKVVAPDNPRWINSKTIEIQCGGISFVLTCEIKFVSADGKGMGYRDMRFVTLDAPLAGRKGEK